MELVLIYELMIEVLLKLFGSIEKTFTTFGQASKITFLYILPVIGLFCCVILWVVHPIPGQWKYLFNRLINIIMEVSFFVCLIGLKVEMELLKVYAFIICMYTVHYTLELHLEIMYVSPEEVVDNHYIYINWLSDACILFDLYVLLCPTNILNSTQWSYFWLVGNMLFNNISVIVMSYMKSCCDTADTWLNQTRATINVSLLYDNLTLVSQMMSYFYVVRHSLLGILMVNRIYQAALRRHNSAVFSQLLDHSRMVMWDDIRHRSVGRRLRNGLLCSVCHKRLYLLGELIHLRCGHVFHRECLQPWLKQFERCPHCLKSLKGNRNVNQQTRSLNQLLERLHVAQRNSGILPDDLLQWHMFRVRTNTDYFANDGDYLYVQAMRDHGMLILGAKHGFPERRAALVVHHTDLQQIAMEARHGSFSYFWNVVEYIIPGAYSRLGFDAIGELAQLVSQDAQGYDSD